MNAPHSMLLPDVQSSQDLRKLPIALVGVKSMRVPVMVATADGAQPSVAMVNMYVSLPADKKGTHMSRFIEVLQANAEPLSLSSARKLMQTMLTRLEAQNGLIEMTMPYFVKKAAPVSGVESLMDYELTLRIEAKNGAVTVWQTLVVPVTSLCPCSRDVSEYGAHNQRSHLTISAELGGEMTVEQQIRIAENAASSELWALLKRPDEKYVTEHAYDNPKFVEDLVRDIALALNQDSRVLAYMVESENFESIHNHSAYAMIERDKRVPLAS